MKDGIYTGLKLAEEIIKKAYYLVESREDIPDDYFWIIDDYVDYILKDIEFAKEDLAYEEE